MLIWLSFIHIWLRKKKTHNKCSYSKHHCNKKRKTKSSYIINTVYWQYTFLHILWILFLSSLSISNACSGHNNIKWFVSCYFTSFKWYCAIVFKNVLFWVNYLLNKSTAIYCHSRLLLRFKTTSSFMRKKISFRCIVISLKCDPMLHSGKYE